MSPTNKYWIGPMLAIEQFTRGNRGQEIRQGSSRDYFRMSASEGCTSLEYGVFNIHTSFVRLQN